MTDPDWMYQNLKDDLALQMYLFAQGLTNEVEWSKVERLSSLLELDPPEHGSAKSARKTVLSVLNKYGFAATKYILTKVRDFTERTNRKLLIILFDPSRVMRALIESGERYDQDIVDFLEKNGFSYFDMNLVHVEDFKDFDLSLDDYMRRYFIGHYNPAGNHFFAFSVKDTLLSLLDPKPITYRKESIKLAEFGSYVE
jgi:hypothetical protein